MFIVEKEGQRQALESDIQVDAYLSCGWSIVPEEVEVVQPKAKPEKVEVAVKGILDDDEPKKEEPKAEEAAPIEQEKPVAPKRKRTYKRRNA